MCMCVCVYVCVCVCECVCVCASLVCGCRHASLLSSFSLFSLLSSFSKNKVHTMLAHLAYLQATASAADLQNQCLDFWILGCIQFHQFGLDVINFAWICWIRESIASYSIEVHTTLLDPMKFEWMSSIWLRMDTIWGFLGVFLVSLGVILETMGSILGRLGHVNLTQSRPECYLDSQGCPLKNQGQILEDVSLDFVVVVRF